MRMYETFIMEKETVYHNMDCGYEEIKQDGKFKKWFLKTVINLLVKYKFLKNGEIAATNFDRVSINTQSVMELIYKSLNNEMYNMMIDRNKFKVIMGYEYFSQLKLEPKAQYRLRQEIKLNGNRGLYFENIEIILTPRIDGMFLLEE